MIFSLKICYNLVLVCGVEEERIFKPFIHILMVIGLFRPFISFLLYFHELHFLRNLYNVPEFSNLFP